MNPSCIYNRQSKAVRALWNFLTSPTGAFLIAVSAILIGYYQFYISRPILKYTTETTEISSASGSDDFKIHINGKDYPKLYKTSVTLSNTGEDALAGSDVSSLGHDPIRIPIPPRVKILYYGINNAETSSDVSAKLIKTDNAIVIEFNYLNPDNQITVNMYSEDNYDKFEILGSAVNVNRITQAWSPEQTRKFIIGTIAGIILFYTLFIYLYVRRQGRQRLHTRFAAPNATFKNLPGAVCFRYKTTKEFFIRRKQNAKKRKQKRGKKEKESEKSRKTMKPYVRGVFQTQKSLL